MAGSILPLLGPVGTGFVGAVVVSFTAEAGGARAAATSGFESAGGVGAF